jgi:pyruvate/2-oxoacid:ferredoxin oxidoreductase beta subunit
MKDRCGWSGKKTRIMSDAERALARSRVQAVCPGCGQTVTLSRWSSAESTMILAPHKA